MGDHVCMNQYVNAQDIHVLSWKIVNSKFTKLLFYPLKTVSFREMRNSTLQKDEKFNKFVLLFFFINVLQSHILKDKFLPEDAKEQFLRNTDLGRVMTRNCKRTRHTFQSAETKTLGSPCLLRSKHSLQKTYG